MNNRYAILVATSIFAISSTSAQVNAATKSKQQLNLKVATVHAGDQKLSGTTTKGAKIKVTRYTKTYGIGKVTAKSGKFTFKLKQSVKANWHYRVTVTKKGYKTKVVHFGTIKKAGQTPEKSKHDVDVVKLQTQIDELKAQLAKSQTNNNSAEVANLKNQISDLQAQIASIKDGLGWNNTEGDELDHDPNSEANKRQRDRDTLRAKIDSLSEQSQELSSLIDKRNEMLYSVREGDSKQALIYYNDNVNFLENLKSQLVNDPQNQNLQFSIEEAKSRVERSKQELEHQKQAEATVGDRVMDYKKETDALKAKMQEIDRQEQALQQQLNNLDN